MYRDFRDSLCFIDSGLLNSSGYVIEGVELWAASLDGQGVELCFFQRMKVSWEDRYKTITIYFALV